MGQGLSDRATEKIFTASLTFYNAAEQKMQREQYFLGKTTSCQTMDNSVRGRAAVGVVLLYQDVGYFPYRH